MLVFCRMIGMIVFNPLLSRKGMPTKLKVALALGMTMLLAPGVPPGNAALAGKSDLAMVFCAGRELLVGLACGFVFQIFYYMLFFAGDVMDYEFGMSMAKVFDPGTNIQMSVSSHLLQFLFVMYIFATNSHLLLIRIISSSYQIVPVGAANFGTGISKFLITLFVSVFSLAMRLLLPYMAAEFVLSIVMGILMKLIPEINVFVVSLQVQIFLGILLLFLFAGPMSTFLDQYIQMLFQNMEKALYAMGAA